MAELPDELWLEHLHGKHECFPHGHLVTKEFDWQGETVRLLLPEYYSHFSVRTLARSGEVLFVLGVSQEEAHRDQPLGVLVVARRIEDKLFAVHLWHETYPWLFKYLGLTAPEM